LVDAFIVAVLVFVRLWLGVVITVNLMQYSAKFITHIELQLPELREDGD